MESKWVGESEENWRTLFDTARENQPSILFIDEFDAVAKKRGGADVYGDKVVNQILTLMSDIEKNGDDIFVITATNKLDMLDDAVMRSGRFGKHIEVKAPNTKESIMQIFDIHSKNKPLSNDVSKDELATKLLDKHATGADIAYIVNNAHENAFERSGIYEKMENGTFSKSDIDELEITKEDFEKALDVFNTNTKPTRKPIGYNK
jgi:SpoVK/Ycf46/Vps4 family AAA+-type ATPase